MIPGFTANNLSSCAAWQIRVRKWRRTTAHHRVEIRIATATIVLTIAHWTAKIPHEPCRPTEHSSRSLAGILFGLAATRTFRSVCVRGRGENFRGKGWTARLAFEVRDQFLVPDIEHHVHR